MRSANLEPNKAFPWGHITGIAAYLLIGVLVLGVARIDAQTTDPDMTNVKDVLAGRRTILQVDDIFIVQSTNPGNAQVSTIPTAGSTFSGGMRQLETINACAAYVPSFATQAGWILNRPSQVLATLFACHGSSGWFVYLEDNLGPLGQGTFPTEYSPVGYTGQLLLGDFIGSGFDQLLTVFVDQKTSGTFDLLARVGEFKATNTTDPLVITESFTFGDPYQLLPPSASVPTGTQVAAGDFDGDGRKEIAVLLPDGQTIRFFSVDPSTLDLTLVSTVTLKNAVRPAALAAGRFRSPANADLAVIGQVQGSPVGTTVTLLAVTPDGSGGFTIAPPSLTPVSAQAGNPILNVLAQAAPLEDWNSNIDQLIYTSNKTSQARDSTGHLIIGSFDANSLFTMQSDTDVTKKLSGCVHSFAPGNFDNRDANGSHVPNLSLSVYWSSGAENCVLTANSHSLELDLWQVDTTGTLNWLGDKAFAELITPRAGGLQSVTMIVGDLRGRSLRLGPPEIITIDSHIQPDIVLGMPPMHVDYINPPSGMTQSGCGDPQTPCVLNLTVRPTVPSPGTPFATQFKFQSGASSTATHTSTTSWSVGVKETINESITWGIPKVDFVSLDIREAFQYTHDQTVKNTYSTYSSQTDQLTVTTGFADNVFFTSQRHNIYQYPVLGQFVCRSTNPSCAESDKKQMYLTFSVPDQIRHSQVDATNLEWYQPLQEPGNVFSYPGSKAQLQSAFPGVTVLSEDPAPVQATDTSSTAYGTSWGGSGTTERTSGTVNSFGESLGMSLTAGVKDPPFVSENSAVSLDVSGSESFASLNTSTQTLSASEGITVTKPSFADDVVGCCQYDFSGYILGNKPFADTFQQIDLKDGNGSPLNISSFGPLYVGFTANPLSDQSGTWWRRAYTLPDVGFNHPARWQWDGSAVKFNEPSKDPATALTFAPAFYQMKGLFINRAGDPLSGPNMTTANAGDRLQLTARVYNFSPVATDDPTLVHPAQTIFVTFWVQEYDAALRKLVGSGFVIDAARIARIPGFDPASSVPNWVLATVGFDTTPYKNMDVVFWVLTFMVDADGNLVPEQPDHGLEQNPSGQRYAQITDVPVEPYSNNVGLYGLYTPLHIYERTAPGEAPAPRNGPATVKTVSVPAKKLVLNHTVQVSADITTGSIAASPVNVLFYDGNPAKGGKLLGFQPIAHIAADSSFGARTSYRPTTCGVRDLYAVAHTNEAGSSTGRVRVHVTIEPVKAVQDLAAALENVPARMRHTLNKVLKAAEFSFYLQDDRNGIGWLDHAIRLLRTARGKILTAEQADTLIRKAEQIVSCRAQ